MLGDIFDIVQPLTGLSSFIRILLFFSQSRNEPNGRKMDLDLLKKTHWNQQSKLGAKRLIGLKKTHYAQKGSLGSKGYHYDKSRCAVIKIILVRLVWRRIILFQSYLRPLFNKSTFKWTYFASDIVSELEIFQSFCQAPLYITYSLLPAFTFVMTQLRLR